MGWNLCIAAERDRERALALDQLGDRTPEDDCEAFDQGLTSLDRHFSYELLRDYGQLRKHLTPEEVEALEPDHIDSPDRWQARDPDRLLAILRGVRERLDRENDLLPLDHFLWFVDEEGKRWNGSTQITLPFGGIELKVPHGPIVKLDGGHRDPKHRNELREYEVRVDPDLLAQFNREVEQYEMEHSLEGESFTFFGPFGPRTEPLVEKPKGWVPVQPVLDVLGCRVEVETVDAQSALRPDLDRAIERIEQAKQSGSPLYWLMQ
jgi:hypothetical protein